MIQYDKELIKKCLKKDRKAQNELYQSCYNFMMAICWRYAKNNEEAVEFLNAGFLKALINLKKYKTKVPFELWLRKVVINEVIDQIRKRKNYRAKIEIREVEELPNHQLVPELNSMQQDKIDWIKDKVKDLPNVTARVFNLYAFDGYKHQEIAKMLNISEGTSQWHYSIAKQKLREWAVKKEA